MNGRGWRIGRILGVDLLVRPSLIVMGVVLVLVFVDRFEQRDDPLVLAVGFVVGLYVSVFVHELAHVVAALSYRMRVRSVTLHLMGGETAIEGDSRGPAQELVTAGVGPLASLLIGVACLGVEDRMSGTVGELVWILGTVNILVAAFNMIPGLPLDGGRVARAVVWAATGREATGIRIAAWIGRLTAAALVVVGVQRAVADGDALSLVIALIVAWFLWEGASHGLVNADRSARLNALSARRVARPAVPPQEAPTLSADLTGSELLRAIADRPADAYLVTEADGTVIGVLTLDDLDAAFRSGT